MEMLISKRKICCCLETRKHLFGQPLSEDVAQQTISHAPLRLHRKLRLRNAREVGLDGMVGFWRVGLIPRGAAEP